MVRLRPALAAAKFGPLNPSTGARTTHRANQMYRSAPDCLNIIIQRSSWGLGKAEGAVAADRAEVTTDGELKVAVLA